MKILVCVKRVPAPGAKINVTGDGLAVDAAYLGFATSPHEECAVEEAVRIVEQEGGTVTVLSLGAPESEEQLRYAASVGAHEIILIPTDGTAWDPQRTANAIAEAIRTREAEAGTFDLLLFGNESADAGGFQVGVRVAQTLERPMVNGIKDIETGHPNAIVARRPIDSGYEVYRLPLPAALGVKEGINLPRYPTMKGRLASKKVEMVTAETGATSGGQTLVRLHRPTETMNETEILGTDISAASAVVDLLEQIEVLS